MLPIKLKTFLTVTSLVLIASCGKKDEKANVTKSLSIKPDSVTVKKDNTTSFSAMLTKEDGTEEDISTQVTWSTESTGSIAKFAETGNQISALAIGSDVVIAKFEDLEAKATVEVAAADTEASANDPTNLAAASSSVSQITLSWTTGGGTTAGFTIAYSQGATAPADCSLGTVIASTTIATATSYNITSLTDNTTYSFRVCAVNTSGAKSAGVTISKATLAYQRIFVGTNTYTGSTIGGLSGADAKCQADAVSASLGGTWKAILSSSAQSAASRISVTRSIQNMRPAGSGGPQIIATSATDLWDGTLAYSINYSANGGAPAGTAIWTGSTSAGAYDASGACSNWTSTTGSSARGLSSAVNSTWISNATATCATGQRLYCIDGQ